MRSRIAMRPLVADFAVAKNRVESSIVKARIEVWRAVLANMRRGGCPFGAFVRLCAFDPALIFSLGKAIRTASARGE